MNEEAETKDETAKLADAVWLEPSPVGGEFMRHAQAMEPASRVPVYKAFPIVPGYNVGMLRKMAESYKPKRIVVIDHEENGFEVRRLGNNDDVSLFYASIKQISESSEKVFGLSDFEKFLEEYKTATFEQIEKYKAVNEQMKRDAVVSYSYLHKRLTKLAFFKNSEHGETTELKKAIEAAIEAELITELPPNLCKEVYKSSARLFKLV